MHASGVVERYASLPSPRRRHLRCDRSLLCTQADFVFAGLILLIGFLCTGLQELGELGAAAFLNGNHPQIMQTPTASPGPSGGRPPVVRVLRLQMLRLLSDGCAAQFNCCQFQLWLQVSCVAARQVRVLAAGVDVCAACEPLLPPFVR